MLLRITILSLLVLFFGCSPDPEETESGSPQEAETEEYMSGESEIDYSGQAIIVTDGVNARSGPSVKKNIVKSFKLGEITEITDSTEERFQVTSGDACDDYGYRWYQVEDQKGKSSWVYGKFLYHAETARNRHHPIGQSFQINGQKWFFGVAVERSYGASDSDGLSGCDMRFMPFFYQQGMDIVLPIFYDPTIIPSYDLDMHSDLFSDKALLLTEISDGGSIMINQIKPANSSSYDLDINMELFYQDGTADGTLSVRKKEGYFEAVNFTKN